MKHLINRRDFITASAALAGGVGLGIGPGTAAAQAPAAPPPLTFKTKLQRLDDHREQQQYFIRGTEPAPRLDSCRPVNPTTLTEQCAEWATLYSPLTPALSPGERENG